MPRKMFLLVDSLDSGDDDIDLQSIDTTVAASAFMRNELTPRGTSTP